MSRTYSLGEMIQSYRLLTLIVALGTVCSVVSFIFTFQNPANSMPWQALIVYLLLTAAVVVLVSQLINRNLVIRQRVAESTDRYRVLNAELQATQRYLRKLLDSVPDPIFFKNRDHQWIDGNQAFWELMGAGPEKFIGKSDYEFFPKSEADVFWEKDNAVFENGGIVENQEFFTDHSGRQRILFTRKVAVTNEKGEKVLAGIIHDMTDLREKDIALRQSEQRFQLAVKGTRDGIWDWEDTSKDEVYWSPQFSALLGYQEHELKGSVANFFQNILHPDDAPSCQEKVNICLRNHTPLDIEYRLRTKSGEYKWFLAKGYVTMDGGVLRMTGSTTDIHERKLLEQEREMLIERLARTNEELERFAYVASHDLQEPLRMIANFTAILSHRYHDTLDDRAKEYLKISSDSATRMQQMIIDLLEYARLGNEAALITQVDCEEAFARVIENLHVTIQERGAVVTNDPLPIIIGNPVRFTSLLQNLIGNALKYQKPGESPRIHVGVREDGGMWVFSISDNGIGIKPEYFDRIFHPFKRLHTRQQYSGTGMGLTICKKIVETMEGRMWLESVPDDGSVFYFSIPKIAQEKLQ